MIIAGGEFFAATTVKRRAGKGSPALAEAEILPFVKKPDLTEEKFTE